MNFNPFTNWHKNSKLDIQTNFKKEKKLNDQPGILKFEIFRNPLKNFKLGFQVSTPDCNGKHF